MKFEREKDIAAFKGKNWREKWSLRNKADARDPWIPRLRMLIYFFVIAPAMAFSCFFADRFFPHYQFLAAVAIFVVVGLPINMMLHAFFIVPRIRKALDAVAS
jgi:hypothetical protein